MSEHQRPDTLLRAARLLAWLGQILCMVASVGIAGGIIVLATFGRDEVFARIDEAQAPVLIYPLVLFAFALIIVMLQLGYRFLRELGGIIDTVGEGHPFAPDNAVRLERMGWLSVGGQVLGLVLAGIAAFIVPYLARLSEAKGEQFDLDFGANLGGILLTLVLFILARVFREGAAMREELEGTV